MGSVGGDHIMKGLKCPPLRWGDFNLVQWAVVRYWCWKVLPVRYKEGISVKVFWVRDATCDQLGMSWGQFRSRFW